jgi:hypothetical protein
MPDRSHHPLHPRWTNQPREWARSLRISQPTPQWGSSLRITTSQIVVGSWDEPGQGASADRGALADRVRQQIGRVGRSGRASRSSAAADRARQQIGAPAVGRGSRSQNDWLYTNPRMSSATMPRGKVTSSHFASRACLRCARPSITAKAAPITANRMALDQ